MGGPFFFMLVSRLSSNTDIVLQTDFRVAKSRAIFNYVFYILCCGKLINRKKSSLIMCNMLHIKMIELHNFIGSLLLKLNFVQMLFYWFAASPSSLVQDHFVKSKTTTSVRPKCYMYVRTSQSQ
jgi:hypothetical protein